MARLARVVVPGVPHHVTQRGNRRQAVFFAEDDCRSYLRLLAEWCHRERVAVWAYCLMPNHVHLVVVPETEHGLARAIGEAHRRYTGTVNRRGGWTGYLWQGRFASCPLDERHLLVAACYIELNPVRAGLVRKPWQYEWSSAAAHLSGRNDLLVDVKPLLGMVKDWRGFLESGIDDTTRQALRLNTRTGRPLGDDAFLKQMEARVGRPLGPKKQGRRRLRAPGNA